MNVQERLRQLIDHQENRLRADIPSNRQAAILALVRARDRIPSSPGIDPLPDLVTGGRLADPGGNRALRFLFEFAGVDENEVTAAFDERLDSWGERFLRECGSLVEAELVQAHCESGFMRIAEDGNGTFDAWIAAKRVPASWRERADIDWWASWLARRDEPELHALRSAQPVVENDDPGLDSRYRRLANIHLKIVAFQLGYPSDAVIGGCAVQTYRDVLGQLIGRALRARDRGEAWIPQFECSLATTIGSALAIDPAVVGRAIAAFTLDRETAAYHAAVPGVAAAPLIRIDPDRLVWSFYGLMTEPWLFLTRELKRLGAEEYHNSAYLREDFFRQELFGLFEDKRFVTSAGRIQLRRTDGDIRTDIDAVVFDRKTGTLGLFELKSQDPFARSSAELVRRRNNILYANRQISGVLDWLKRYGADELLGRVDARTTKTFRAQRVYPFVLGRYLVHFSDGPEPDRRAAWGTWPQVMRLLEGQPFGATDANPLASLFNRLTKDGPLVGPPAGAPPREIAVGSARLIVHPSYADFQANAAGRNERAT